MSKTTAKKQVKLCYEHVGGKMGSLLLERFVANGWLAKTPGKKELYITEKGMQGFNDLGIDLSKIEG
ncbi:MAG: ArsR family transcriptional regulator [Citrobacter freundii]|nr:MAG: ArsR family transcriptional regulator [Citrobacter freundii]